MSTPNRAALLTKIHKVLKRTYKHTPTKGDQPLLESLLFACLLGKRATTTSAQAYLTKVRAAFFDWNEIRVSTVKELAEVMHELPEPAAAAARLKGILQSVFESDYSFDLEHLKKQNIGAAVKRLQKLQGATPFIVAYATQVGAGRPFDSGRQGHARRAVRSGRDQRNRGRKAATCRAWSGRFPRARDKSSAFAARVRRRLLRQPVLADVARTVAFDRSGRQGPLPQADVEEAAGAARARGPAAGASQSRRQKERQGQGEGKSGRQEAACQGRSQTAGAGSQGRSNQEETGRQAGPCQSARAA